MQTVRVGTRGSPLALRQAEEVIALLKKAHPECRLEVIRIETTGDKDKITPLEKLEGSDFFTREIEEALSGERIDLAVHSAKDLPDVLPDGLEIAVVFKSIEPCDALVSKNNLKLEELPSGAKIGTSSRRRKTQLKSFRKDFQIFDIRGDIEERLKRLDGKGSGKNKLDAIVIAAAGLIRLGLEDKITERLSFDILKPHPLQGCLAIEIRAGDMRIKNLVLGLQ